MKYQVAYPLSHNGDKYQPGDSIDLGDAAAAAHVLSGVLIPAPFNPSTTPIEPSATVGISPATIANFYADAELPTDRKPSVKETLTLLRDVAPNSITVKGVVIDVKDYEVSAALRDDAWALYLSGDYSDEHIA